MFSHDQMEVMCFGQEHHKIDPVRSSVHHNQGENDLLKYHLTMGCLTNLPLI